MRSVDFIYFGGCPHIEQTRAHLRQAFDAVGAEPRWLEWDASDPATPDEFRQHGSPTVLINGRDVAGVTSATGGGCRVYDGGDGLTGVPSVPLLIAALGGLPSPAASAATAPPKLGWRRLLAVAPSLAVAAVPVGTCPVCIAGTVGALSALGIGFLLETRFLLPITVLALTLALGSLAWRARARWGYSPLVLGIVGAITLSVGQFVVTSAQTTVIGAIVLMAAALWNALPRARNGASCADCVPRVPTERQR